MSRRNTTSPPRRQEDLPHPITPPTGLPVPTCRVAGSAGVLTRRSFLSAACGAGGAAAAALLAGGRALGGSRSQVGVGRAAAGRCVAYQAPELPPADAVEPVEVIITGDYTEGIVFGHDGSGYFSHGEIVTRIGPEGEASTWARTGAPNGHKILADGTHLICDASHHAVLHLDADGNMLDPAATECGGVPLRGPNDLTLDPEGGFYFSDPGGSGSDNPIGTVHYVDGAGTCHLVAEGLAFPNGIVLTPDRTKLYVAESQQNRVLVYELEEPGVAGTMEVFADLPSKDEEAGQIDNQPDGMCLDAAGNLYVAHYGMRQVQVLSPSGELIRRYPGGNVTTSNVAFGGPDWTRLYMTGGDPGGVFMLELGVPGLVILPEAAS